MIFFYKKFHKVESGINVKRYNGEETCFTNYFEIIVDFCYDCSDDVLASTDIDLTDEEQLELLKSEVISDFDGFISLVAKRIKAGGYELLEPPKHTPYSKSNSWYLVLCNKKDHEELTVKLILNVRISDHRSSRYKKGDKEWDRFKAREDHYNRELENYRFLNEYAPDDMLSTLIEIKVGGTVYHNFLSASNHVLNEIKKYI